MSFWLIAVIALLTYGSRAAGLVFLPAPSARVQSVLSRVPAPLFAGFASLSLVGENGQLAGPPVLAAMLGALALSPTRSLLKILVGGFLGWSIMVWIDAYLGWS